MSEYNLKLRAVLDSSQIKQQLEQLNQNNTYDQKIETALSNIRKFGAIIEALNRQMTDFYRNMSQQKQTRTYYSNPTRNTAYAGGSSTGGSIRGGMSDEFLPGITTKRFSRVLGAFVFQDMINEASQSLKKSRYQSSRDIGDIAGVVGKAGLGATIGMSMGGPVGSVLMGFGSGIQEMISTYTSANDKLVNALNDAADRIKDVNKRYENYIEDREITKLIKSGDVSGLESKRIKLDNDIKTLKETRQRLNPYGESFNSAFLEYQRENGGFNKENTDSWLKKLGSGASNVLNTLLEGAFTTDAIQGKQINLSEQDYETIHKKMEEYAQTVEQIIVKEKKSDRIQDAINQIKDRNLKQQQQAEESYKREQDQLRKQFIREYESDANLYRKSVEAERTEKEQMLINKAIGTGNIDEQLNYWQNKLRIYQDAYNSSNTGEDKSGTYKLAGYARENVLNLLGGQYDNLVERLTKTMTPFQPVSDMAAIGMSMGWVDQNVDEQINNNVSKITQQLQDIKQRMYMLSRTTTGGMVLE